MKRFARLLKGEKLNEDKQITDVCQGQDIGTDGWKPKWSTWIISGRWTWPTWTSWEAIIICMDICWSPWARLMKTKLMPSSLPYCTAREMTWCPNSSRQMVQQVWRKTMEGLFHSESRYESHDGWSIDWSTQIHDIKSCQCIERIWHRHLRDVLGCNSRVLQWKSPFVGWVGVWHCSTCIGRVSYQNRFYTRVILILVFSPERFCDVDNTFESVSWKIRLWREVLDRGWKKRLSSARFIWPIQSCFERFARQTVGWDFLFGRIKRGMNLQLTSNQNLSYRMNTTNGVIVEINVRDGDMYVLVNKIFYPTTLSSMNKMTEKDFCFDFEIIKEFCERPIPNVVCQWCTFWIWNSLDTSQVLWCRDAVQ